MKKDLGKKEVLVNILFNTIPPTEINPKYLATLVYLFLNSF